MLNDKNLLDCTLLELGVHSKGDAKSPTEGLIASNLFVDTVERGRVVIRANELGDSSGVGFEARALDFLGNNGAPVPTILRFNDNALEKRIGGKRVIAYLPIDGDTLSANELDSPKLAADAGSLLSSIMVLAERYEPNGNEPNGDATYIRKITDDLLSKYPDLVESTFFEEAIASLSSKDYLDAIEKSSKGIVHADFFYENIIKKDDQLVGVIDFGDAYYGALVNDIAIGAMEFSVLEAGEQWKAELFEAFLRPNVAWLRQNGIDFNAFKSILLANCLRFAVYTLGFERKDNHAAAPKQNRYVQRYAKFDGELSEMLRKSYEIVYNRA